MKGYAFLFWAYTIVWLGIAAYVGFLGARLRTVGMRLASLERSLEAREGRGDQSGLIASKKA